MISIHKATRCLVVLVLAVGLFVGCASTAYINVDYQLPLVADSLKGRKVFLEYSDTRASKTFLSPTAQAQFAYFTGIFSLTLNEDGRKNLVGSFDAASLFKEALKRRLNSQGVEVVLQPDENQPVLEIILKDFFLDLKDRKWIARISFETRLVGKSGRTAAQTVAGSAERLKTIGRGDAEKVLSEIFTDAVNDIKILELFEKAGL